MEDWRTSICGDVATRRRRRRWCALVLACLLVQMESGVVRAADSLTPTAQTIEGLRMPLRWHSNGRVETMLLADRARMTDVGVSAEGNIRLVLMDEDGVTNGVAGAMRGHFNQEEMTADCEGPVFLRKDGVQLSGTNFHWEAKLNIVRVETNAVLVLDRGGRSAVEELTR